MKQSQLKALIKEIIREANDYLQSRSNLDQGVMGFVNVEEGGTNICPACNGSGEGPADGTKCQYCGGSGDSEHTWPRRRPERDPDDERDARLDRGEFGDIEEIGQSSPMSGPWNPIGGGKFRISDELAAELAHGKPAKPGYEALVPAPKGFESTKGFVWLSQKVVGGQMSWIIRDSGNWVMKNGKITVAGTVAEGSVNEMDLSADLEAIMALAKSALKGSGYHPKKAIEKLRQASKSVQSKNDPRWQEFAMAAQYLKDAIPLGGTVGEQSVSGGAGAYSTPFAFKKTKNEELDEMTATGAVAGYATPYAFSKKKSGSQRAIDATKKIGYKVVGDTPRV